MIILHGENQGQSRQKLQELLTQAKQAGRQLQRLDASLLSLAVIEEIFGASDLFGETKTVVIEGLHSLVKSKKKDDLLKAITQSAVEVPEHIEVILWENRALTKTMIAKFPGSQALEFKISSSVFKWLDSLSPQPKTKSTQLKLFHQAIAEDDVFMCFAMLCRQIRLLIQVKDGGQVKGAPFMVAKLTKQAQLFTLPQLLTAHTKLLECDVHQKTSSSPLSLEQELDLLLLQL